MKRKRWFGIAVASVLACLVMVIGVVRLYGVEEMLPVYVYNGQQQTSIYGMPAKVHTMYGKTLNYKSIDLKTWSNEAILPEDKMQPQTLGIQLIYEVTEEDIDRAWWEEVYTSLEDYEDQIWLSIYTKDQALEQGVEQIQRMMTTNREKVIHCVKYPQTIEEADKLLKQGEKWIGVNVEDEADIIYLAALQKKATKNTHFLVNDYLLRLEEVQNHTKNQLIQSFYYDMQRLYPQVKAVFIQEIPTDYPVAFQNTYKRVIGLPWMNQLPYEKTVEAKGYDQYEKDTLNVNEPTWIMTPIKDESIEYVQYKVNGDSVDYAGSYPYATPLSSNAFYKGNNEVKVIVKYKDKEKLTTKKFYIYKTSETKVNSRAKRVTPTYKVGQKPIYEKSYIPVLMYHKFKDQVEPTEEDQSMSVSTKLFEEHLSALQKAGYTAVTLKDLHDYLEGRGGLPEKPYIITTDDGYLNNYTHGYPILKKYNVPATFFVTPQYVGVTTVYEHFDWDQAREMEQSGLIDIQSHTNSHVLLDRAHKEEVNYEVLKSFGHIEKELGKRDVKALAYPQFEHNKKTKKWLEEWGIDLQMTNLTRHGKKTTTTDVKRIHVHNEMSGEELIQVIEKNTN